MECGVKSSVMKMTSLDNMNIIKDLFIVPTEPVVKEEEKKGEIIENAINDSFRRDKNNLKFLMEVCGIAVMDISLTMRSSSYVWLI